jgi:hypothetical protein
MTTDPFRTDVHTESASFSSTAKGVAFDPNLIKKLTGDHAGLIAIFTRLRNTEHSHLSSVPADLALLREAFQDHIMTEKVHFYAYLDRLLVDHPSVREEAHAVWKDMNEIATSIARFIHNWISTPPTEQSLPAFYEQLNRTMQMLIARIELEEVTLYTLYTETL